MHWDDLYNQVKKEVYEVTTQNNPIQAKNLNILRFFMTPPQSKAKAQISMFSDKSRLRNKQIIYGVIHTITYQRYQTQERMKNGKMVEDKTVHLLLNCGYIENNSKIYTPYDIKTYEFKRNVILQTIDGSRHEVDILVGGKIPQLIECKFSGTPINGKKRCDSIVKKATSWKRTFPTCRTVAVLHGAFYEIDSINKLNAYDVQRFMLNDTEYMYQYFRIN